MKDDPAEVLQLTAYKLMKDQAAEIARELAQALKKAFEGRGFHKSTAYDAMDVVEAMTAVVAHQALRTEYERVDGSMEIDDNMPIPFRKELALRFHAALQEGSEGGGE